MSRFSGILLVLLAAAIAIAVSQAKPTIYKRNQDNVFEPGESVLRFLRAATVFRGFYGLREIQRICARICRASRQPSARNRQASTQRMRSNQIAGKVPAVVLPCDFLADFTADRSTETLHSLQAPNFAVGTLIIS